MTKKLIFSGKKTFSLEKDVVVVVNVQLTKQLSCFPHLSTDLLPLRKLIEVSFTGEIREHGRLMSCGQIHCSLSDGDLPEDLERIVSLWRKVHLNGMKAGTKIQDECLLKHMVGSYEYGKACDVLKENGLCNDRGYIYGHSWLCEKVPSKDLREIIRLFS
jgi:hypothetical protein